MANNNKKKVHGRKAVTGMENLTKALLRAGAKDGAKDQIIEELVDAKLAILTEQWEAEQRNAVLKAEAEKKAKAEKKEKELNALELTACKNIGKVEDWIRAILFSSTFDSQKEAVNFIKGWRGRWRKPSQQTFILRVLASVDSTTIPVKELYEEGGWEEPLDVLDLDYYSF